MRKSTIISIGSVTLALLVMSANVALASSGKQQRTGIPQEITSLQSQITSLESNIASLQSTVKQQAAEISSQKSDIASLQSTVKQQESEISSQQSDIASLQSTVKQQTAEMTNQQSEITSVQSTLKQQSSTGTLTSDNSEYSIRVTDNGITLSGPNSQIVMNESGMTMKELTGGIILQGLTGVTLQAGGNRVSVNPTGATVVGTTVQVKGSGNLKITGGGITDINGAIIRLNGGARPVSGAGDAVAVNGTSGQIVTGSATVFVGN